MNNAQFCCGLVAKAVTSDARDLWFKSSVGKTS